MLCSGSRRCGCKCIGSVLEECVLVVGLPSHFGKQTCRPRPLHHPHLCRQPPLKHTAQWVQGAESSTGTCLVLAFGQSSATWATHQGSRCHVSCPYNGKGTQLQLAPGYNQAWWLCDQRSLCMPQKLLESLGSMTTCKLMLASKAAVL